MRVILQFIFVVFVIMIVGSVLIDTFPVLQPAVDEGMAIFRSLWDQSIVKYGTMTTVVIAIGLLFLLSGKK